MFGMILFAAVGLGKVALACAVCLLLGFGVGRIKNSAKLQRVSELVGNAEHYVTQEARELVAAIKVHLP